MRKLLMKHSKYTLLGIAVIALITGIWIALSPQMEKQNALAEQERLMESITQGDGTITLDSKVTQTEPDFYEETPAFSNTGSAGEMFIPDVDTEAEDMPLIDSQEITGIGVLKISKIDLALPVVDGVTKSKLKVAVGRVPRTAEIGSIGNAVIAGHRSYSFGKYFNRLGELEIGDVIEYQSKDGKAMNFEVYNIRTIMPGDQSAFRQPKDFAEITLYTCTPIRVASHRLLIIARLIKEETK